MGNGEVFLDTGIQSLNDLMTRSPHLGIAMPSPGGFASSTTIIKGAAGAGKSVLTSIMSYNMHGRPVRRESQAAAGESACSHLPYLPVVIYFSYAQPAQGIYRYLEEIRAAKDDNLNPIIISPKYSLGASELGGISTLRRSLISSLALFRTLPFEPYQRSARTGEGKKKHTSDRPSKAIGESLDLKFEQCINHLIDSDIWQLGKDRKKLNMSLSSELPEKMPKDTRIVPIVVIDPINFFFDYRDSRAAIADLISTFRTLQWPLLMTLEDGGKHTQEGHRQLASYVEFEADLVVELTITSEPHIRRSIEITKSRNMQPRFGRQMYRIEKPEHAFSNIFPSDKEGNSPRATNHPGFMIFPSIHWVLSLSYERNDTPKWHHRSGIAVLDEVLDKKAKKSETSRYLPPDASILVRGEKGGHKLPLSFNLLVRGLEEGSTPDDNRVMLVCLGEETYMTIPDIPLACGVKPRAKDRNFNNGTTLKFESKPLDGESMKQSKVMCHRWVAKSVKSRRKKGELIEVTFKPGYLTPEEFLWVIDNLVKQYKPKRVMIDNTAHLRMRFPDLFSEKMLFPALSCMAKANNQHFMLIVTDVTGKGSWEELSYGLSAGADVVIDVEPITKEEYSENEALRKQLADNAQKVPGKQPTHKKIAPIWSKISVSNVRGKQYERKRHAVTVLPVKDGGSYTPRLFMVDITGATTPSMKSLEKKTMGLCIDKNNWLSAAVSKQ